MRTLETTLKKEVNELKEIIKAAEDRLKNAPQGHLRIKKRKNKIEYYYKNAELGNTSKSGKYIKKSEHNLARQIVQKDYDTNILKRAKARVIAIEEFLDKYKKTNIRTIWENVDPYRKELLDTVILSDEEFVKQWSSISYKGKEFIDEEKEILTERGERVRSKSEKIIADKLYMLGIPYRYEYPLLLKNNVKIYPDFTILKMPEREEVYLEHFGMMDDIDYVNKAFYKITTFEKNGIYLGVKLFITHETSRNPLNTKNLHGMIREVFCEK